MTFWIGAVGIYLCIGVLAARWGVKIFGRPDDYILGCAVVLWPILPLVVLLSVVVWLLERIGRLVGGGL